MSLHIPETFTFHLPKRLFIYFYYWSLMPSWDTQSLWSMLSHLGPRCTAMMNLVTFYSFFRHICWFIYTRAESRDIKMDTSNVFCFPNYIWELINPMQVSHGSQLTIGTFGWFSGVHEIAMFKVGLFDNYFEYHQKKNNSSQDDA